MTDEATRPDLRQLYGIPGPIIGKPKPLTPEQMLGLPPGTIGRAWWQMKPWEAWLVIQRRGRNQESTASGEGQSG